MKRELFQNVKVQPYTSDEAVEKEQFSSAVLGAKIGTAGTLTVTEAATTEPTPPASPKKGCGSALTGMGLSLGAAVLLLAGALALLVLRRKRSN